MTNYTADIRKLAEKHGTKPSKISGLKDACKLVSIYYAPTELISQADFRHSIIHYNVLLLFHQNHIHIAVPTPFDDFTYFLKIDYGLLHPSDKILNGFDIQNIQKQIHQKHLTWTAEHYRTKYLEHHCKHLCVQIRSNEVLPSKGFEYMPEIAAGGHFFMSPWKTVIAAPISGTDKALCITLPAWLTKPKFYTVDPESQDHMPDNCNTCRKRAKEWDSHGRI